MGIIRDRGNDGGNIWRWDTLIRFIKENNYKTGAELGVHDGVSFKNMVKRCPECNLVGVDLYESQPENNGPEKWTPGENGHAWDHKRYYTDLLNFCHNHDNAVIIKDYTTNVAEQYPDGHFDFVFIDADHGYEGCLRDIKAWHPKVREGGRVIGHDIHFPTVQKAVTEFYGENSWNTEDDFIWWIQK